MPPMDTITAIDRYEPDPEQQCEVCGASPVVTGVRENRIVYRSAMCGPCLWNEPKAADPRTWNEQPVG